MKIDRTNTWKKWIATSVLLVAAVGCGGNDDGGGGGNDTQATGDAGPQDTGAAAEGGWTCTENNVAVWKENGWKRPCGTYKCRPGVGCGNTAEGCKSDDRCISNTSELGEPPEVARPVKCIQGACSALPPEHDN